METDKNNSMGISKAVLLIVMSLDERSLNIQKSRMTNVKICTGANAQILTAPLAIGANISIKIRINSII